MGVCIQSVLEREITDRKTYLLGCSLRTVPLLLHQSAMDHALIRYTAPQGGDLQMLILNTGI